jgi:hypothetical protein
LVVSAGNPGGLLITNVLVTVSVVLFTLSKTIDLPELIEDTTVIKLLIGTLISITTWAVSANIYSYSIILATITSVIGSIIIGVTAGAYLNNNSQMVINLNPKLNV